MPRALSPVLAVRGHLQRWAADSQLSCDDRGYVLALADNFFQPPSSCTIEELKHGDGQELGKDGAIGKIQALHSSSALACNIFDYWRGRDTAVLAEALGGGGRFCRIEFEAKFPTGLGGKAPNLDVLLTNCGGGQVAIESKFLEPYGPTKKPAPFKEKYFPAGKGLWTSVNLPQAQRLAERMKAEPGLYKYLDAQQLLKHLLGLGQRPAGLALVYLWFDVGGDAGMQHAAEIASFLSDLAGLPLPVTGMSYQHLHRRMEDLAGPEHRSYLDYIGRRYLAAAGG